MGAESTEAIALFRYRIIGRHQLASARLNADGSSMSRRAGCTSIRMMLRDSVLMSAPPLPKPELDTRNMECRGFH